MDLNTRKNNMAKKVIKEKEIKPKAEKASSASSEQRPKKEAKPKKEVSIEQTLWAAADKLRGTVESSEYKHVVLSLIKRIPRGFASGWDGGNK